MIESFREVALLVRRAHEGGAFDEAYARHDAALRAARGSRDYASTWRGYRRRCQTLVIAVLDWRGEPLARLTAELVVDRFLEKGQLLGAPRSGSRMMGDWVRK